MYYEINKKNIKQSAKNISEQLQKDGYLVPKNKVLELLSKVFFYKNWNTLDGIATSPEKVDSIKKVKRYLIEIETNCPKDKMFKILETAFTNGNCQFNVEDYQSNEKVHLLTLDLTKNNDNVITAIFMLKKEMKKNGYKVERAEMARIFMEKEDMSALFKD